MGNGDEAAAASHRHARGKWSDTAQRAECAELSFSFDANATPQPSPNAAHGIYTVTPGVPAFAAASALLGRELTVPELTQSVVLTRMPGRASAMPPREKLSAFAATGATLVIHLAIQSLRAVVEVLSPLYGADCPVAVVVRASWPDERVLRGTLGSILEQAAAEPIERTALILVGPALAAHDFRESALYDPDYRRRFRGERG